MKSFLCISPVLVLQLLVVCCTGGFDKPRLRNSVKYSSTMAGSMTEGSRTVYGRLDFRSPESGSVKAIITSASGKQLEAKWPEWAKSSSFVDQSKTYKFDLLTRVYREPDYIFNDILRVSDSERTLIDASVCHIHNLPMQRQIEDGKSACAYPEHFFSMQKKRFPNDGNTYLACGSGIRHPKWKCMECHNQYLRWTKSNGVDPNY